MYNVMSGGFITGCIVSAKNGTKSGILVRAVLIHVIWTQPCIDQAGIGFGAFGAAYVESIRPPATSSDSLSTVLISYGGVFRTSIAICTDYSIKGLRRRHQHRRSVHPF